MTQLPSQTTTPGKGPLVLLGSLFSLVSVIPIEPNRWSSNMHGCSLAAAWDVPLWPLSGEPSTGKVMLPL